MGSRDRLDRRDRRQRDRQLDVAGPGDRRCLAATGRLRDPVHGRRPDPSGTDSGIYAVNVADGKVRDHPASADAAGRFRGHPAWSPDGSRISFGEWMGINGIDVQTHIITANGTEDRTLPIPADAVSQAPILVERRHPPPRDPRLSRRLHARPGAVIVPADGSGPGVEIAYAGGHRVLRHGHAGSGPRRHVDPGNADDSSGTQCTIRSLLDP